MANITSGDVKTILADHHLANAEKISMQIFLYRMSPR
ncbi:hypothetical protein F442_21458 [Phytophthora nicotianae P10297]|uniref:Uncharacterized protein n=1 Tax=Phytophthora nicotianae P10297 TaxID=1317064 RepID=W2Y5C9_PHYNI|nr:hypothetical protein F442_21458 [Phytophthora nicotianae P10297]